MFFKNSVRLVSLSGFRGLCRCSRTGNLYLNGDFAQKGQAS